MPLVPCFECRRHVRVSDGVCPFCKTVRAAAKAVVVAASALALAGCGKESAPVAMYGGPPPRLTASTVDPDAGPPVSPRVTAPTTDAAAPAVTMTPMYGTPPPNQKPKP